MGQGWRTGAPGSALSSTAANAAQLLRHVCRLCQAEITSCSHAKTPWQGFLSRGTSASPVCTSALIGV